MAKFASVFFIGVKWSVSDVDIVVLLVKIVCVVLLMVLK